MNDEILAYIDGRIAELREYIDRQLQQHEELTEQNIVRAISEVVPKMVTDIVENIQ